MDIEIVRYTSRNDVLELMMEEGRAEGRIEIITTMYKKGFTLEQIADVIDKDVKEVEVILKKVF